MCFSISLMRCGKSAVNEASSSVGTVGFVGKEKNISQMNRSIHLGDS